MIKGKKYHVKKGDKVVVNSGIWRGEEGEVIAILKKKDRVVLNLSNFTDEKKSRIGKRTIRKTQESKGGLVDRAVSMHVSNVNPVAKEAKQDDK